MSIAELKRENAELKATNAALERENAELKAASLKLQAQVNELQAQVNLMQTIFDSLSEGRERDNYKDHVPIYFGLPDSLQGSNTRGVASRLSHLN